MYFSVNVHCSSRVQLYRHCPIHLFFLKTFIHNFHWFLKYTYLPYNTKFLHPYVFCHGCRLVDWNKTRGQHPQRKGGMIYTEQNEIKLLLHHRFWYFVLWSSRGPSFNPGSLQRRPSLKGVMTSIDILWLLVEVPS